MAVDTRGARIARFVGLRRACLDRGDFNLAAEIDLELDKLGYDPSEVVAEVSVVEAAVPAAGELAVPVQPRRGPGRPPNSSRLEGQL